jgi:hypothetical protein
VPATRAVRLRVPVTKSGATHHSPTIQAAPAAPDVSAPIR